MESSCPKYNSVIKTCNFFFYRNQTLSFFPDPSSCRPQSSTVKGSVVFFLQLEQDLLRRLSVKFAAICSNRPLNSRYNYLKFPQNKPQVRDGLIRLLSLFLNHLYVSSTVLGHTETLSNCLLYRLKTIPREKKREPKPQSQRSRKLGKKKTKESQHRKRTSNYQKHLDGGRTLCRENSFAPKKAKSFVSQLAN